MHVLTKLPVLLLLVLACIVAACGSDTTGPSEASGFRATWAGTPWSGDGSATRIPGGSTGDTLFILGTTPPKAGQLPSGYVRVRILFDGVGTYTLNAQDAEVVYLLGGDVRTAAYATGQSGAGTLRVREFADGWIAGEVAFDAIATTDRAPVGMSARFEGQFRTRVHSRH